MDEISLASFSSFHFECSTFVFDRKNMFGNLLPVMIVSQPGRSSSLSSCTMVQLQMPTHSRAVVVKMINQCFNESMQYDHGMHTYSELEQGTHRPRNGYCLTTCCVKLLKQMSGHVLVLRYLQQFITLVSPELHL